MKILICRKCNKPFSDNDLVTEYVLDTQHVQIVGHTPVEYSDGCVSPCCGALWDEKK